MLLCLMVEIKLLTDQTYSNRIKNIIKAALFYGKRLVEYPLMRVSCVIRLGIKWPLEFCSCELVVLVLGLH